MAAHLVQVLTGTLPLGNQSGPQLAFEVLKGVRPSKPVNVLELGLSNEVWELLEDSWKAEYKLRPPVENVLGRVKSSASVCSILPPVGNAAQQHGDPDSGFFKFGGPLSDSRLSEWSS